jgi:hypothetical protein
LLTIVIDIIYIRMNFWGHKERPSDEPRLTFNYAPVLDTMPESEQDEGETATRR